VAIIGSRTPPPKAAEFAFQFAHDLREQIIAGLAPGIDAAAHRGALAAGTPTVAFVAYGFGCTDPPEFDELEEVIVASGGAIATLLPPGTPASPESRVARDRLQAEHARAVILICSEAGGGAIYTMQFARELGRPRYAIVPPPNGIGFEAWDGNVASLSAGALALPFDVEAALAIVANDRRA
jgi:DNA processing protein